MSAAATAGTPFVLRGRHVRNRIVATAHGSGLIRGGLAQNGDAGYWGRLAQGGAGIVISGATIVSQESTVRSGNLAITFGDDALPGIKARATAIKAAGAFAISQLIHLGRESLGAESWYASAGPTEVRTPRSPSPARVLRADEMDAVIRSFVDAADVTLGAGFEGVELHAAHGYLLEQFLSRSLNDRADRYGPGPDGGLRLILDIVGGIRRNHPESVIGIRLSAIDSMMPYDDVRKVIRRLGEVSAVDYVNLAVGDRGQYVKDMHVESPPLLPRITELSNSTSLPLLVTQGFRSADHVEQALNRGAQLVGMCRALIADPDVPLKIIEGRSREIRPCTGCNEDCRLFDPCLLCSVNPDLAPPGRGRRPAAPIMLSAPAVRELGPVVVVGGGPAGMEAATTLAKSGRAVVLHEASNRLGGQLATAANAPHRHGWTPLLNYYSAMLADLGVDVRFNSAPSIESLTGSGEIILATGAVEQLPDYGEAVKALTCSAFLDAGEDRLSGVNDLVVVDDGFGWWPAVSAVELAVEAGVRQISILTASGSFAMGIPSDGRTQLIPRLAGANIDIRAFLVPERLQGRQLQTRNMLSGHTRNIDADLVVAAGPRKPRPTTGIGGSRVQSIGDCVAARKVAHAISEGRQAALTVLG